MNQPENNSEILQPGPSAGPDNGAAASQPSSQAASGSTRRSSLWFTLRMIEVRLRLILILVGAGLLVGYWHTIENYWDHWTRPPANAVAALGSGTEFYCPMDPSVIRDSLEPDGSVPNCPICGMPLSQRKRGAPVELPPGVVGRLQLSPDRVRLAGIRTAEVEIRPLVSELRTVGSVTYDESRRSRIVTRVSGYLEKLHVNKTFDVVEKGQPLAEIYSPQLYVAGQELLLARNTPRSALLSTVREKMQLLGIDDREIQRILATGNADHRLTIRSPIDGRVIRKPVLEGQNVEAGSVLFEVADLSTMWIEAEIYEKDIAGLTIGQTVEASVEAYPERTFSGRVAAIYPELQETTRTTRVRVEVDNAGGLLQAGMYAHVRLQTPVQQLEPFRTRLAALQQSDTQTDQEIIARQNICPVTGVRLGSMGTPVPTTIGDRKVFVCCSSCLTPLAQKPTHYIARITTLSEAGVLAVPEQAVIDTGKQKIVYVEREPGVYEGVEVELGRKTGNFYPVINGLARGDRVAAAGAFLVDAETRLNPAASAAYFGASDAPRREASTSPSASSPASGDAVADTTLAPKQPFTADELRNLAKLSPEDRALAMAQHICPISGEPLGSMGVPLKREVQGETLFLCCEGCDSQLLAEADKVVRQVRQSRPAEPTAK